jgi:signal transduction histidine kinase
MSESGTNRPRSSADEQLVTTAARKIGIQIALACALAVAIVAVLAFTLLHGHSHGDLGRPAGESPGDDDDVIRDALLIAGGIGILVAGAVGYFTAKRAVRPLGDALALQRRFVADAGHELRTPLTVLHTRAQMLVRRLPVGDPSRVVAEDLLGDSRMLGEIIDELLVSAQLSADPGQGETVDVGVVILEAIATMSVLADQAQINLRNETTLGHEKSVVRGSRSALRRAVIALIDNAIGHLPPGGSVTVANRRDRDWVEVTRLTERFAQGRNTTEVTGSRPIGNQRYGLGLALVREIAVSHGGSFTLQNRDGSGAIATLRIPSADPAS